MCRHWGMASLRWWSGLSDPASKEMVCILCPTGCRLRIAAAADSIQIKGAACERGRDYASSEVIEPLRTFTGTVRISKGERPVVAVKTDRPVLREQLLDVAQAAARVVAKAPVRGGDTIAENVAGGDTRLVATATVRAT